MALYELLRIAGLCRVRGRVHWLLWPPPGWRLKWLERSPRWTHYQLPDPWHRRGWVIAVDMMSLILLIISGFSSCVLKYYNCSESLTDCRQQFSRCSVSSASGSSEQARVTTVTSVTPASPASDKAPVISETGDVFTPSLAQGTGKIPESKRIFFYWILK